MNLIGLLLGVPALATSGGGGVGGALTFMGEPLTYDGDGSLTYTPPLGE